MQDPEPGAPPSNLADEVSDDDLPEPPTEAEADEPEQATEDELEPVDPERLELDRMATILGPMYEEAWDGAIELMEKEHVDYPKDAQRRGKQLATVLRELGWEDDAILAYTGLAVGMASDLAYIRRLPDRDPDEDDEDDDEPGEAAPVQEVPGGG